MQSQGWTNPEGEEGQPTERAPGAERKVGAPEVRTNFELVLDQKMFRFFLNHSVNAYVSLAF